MTEDPPGVPHRRECPEHPGQPAVARCVGCGRLVCQLCRTMVGNRNYCRKCVASTPPGIYYPPQYVPVTQAYPPWQQPIPIAPRRLREPVFPGVSWGVGEAIIIFVVALFSTLALYIPFNTIFFTTAAEATRRVLVVFFTSMMLSTILLAGTYYSVRYRHHSTLSAIGLKFEGTGKGFAWGIGLGIPLFIGALGLGYISQEAYDLIYRAISDRPPSTTSVTGASPGMEPWLWVLLAVTLVVLAPVFEEIFFRGYLYPAIRNSMSAQPAMIINGLIFAAAHFEPIGFLARFLLGYGLCYLYEKNRTLVAPIVGHALYNGLILLLFSLLELF